METNREYKLIFSAGIARNLIKMGVNIADIKADKNNPDKTVFVFKRTAEFEIAFAQINKEIDEAKKSKTEKSESDK